MDARVDPESVLAEVALPDELRYVLAKLQQAGHEAFCVGGAVRDVFLARTSGDWDIATSAEPTQVKALFERVVETGIEHGTVTVCRSTDSYEVTTYRIDVGSTDGRRPDRIEFSRSLREDLQRRDFTMNAMAWDPLNRVFYDPFDGLGAIEANEIRAVGDPIARLSEDGLRSMRAVRFVGTLGFSLEKSLWQAVCKSLHVFEKVSVERIWQELRKLLLGPEAGYSLKLLEDSGMRACFWPNLKHPRLTGFEQLPTNLPLRMALIFSEQPEMFESCAKALKLPNKTKRQVEHLLRGREIALIESPQRHYALKCLSAIGRDGLEDWYQLKLATTEVGEQGGLDLFMAQLRALCESGVALTVSELPINGAWVMDEFGLPPSRLVGQLLDLCLQALWEDDRKMNVEDFRAVIQRRLNEA